MVLPRILYDSEKLCCKKGLRIDSNGNRFKRLQILKEFLKIVLKEVSLMLNTWQVLGFNKKTITHNLYSVHNTYPVNRKIVN